MKEKGPQFLRMNARFEEDPPPRDVGCPSYRSCLTEAAYKNLCLDCSLCAAIAAADLGLRSGRDMLIHKARKTPASIGLPG